MCRMSRHNRTRIVPHFVILSEAKDLFVSNSAFRQAGRSLCPAEARNWRRGPPQSSARPHSGFYRGTGPCYGFRGFVGPRIERSAGYGPQKFASKSGFSRASRSHPGRRLAISLRRLRWLRLAKAVTHPHSVILRRAQPDEESKRSKIVRAEASAARRPATGVAFPRSLRPA